MKTTFRRKFSHDNTQRNRLLSVALVLVAGAALLFVLRSQIIAAVSPLWRSETAVSRGAANLLSMIRGKDALVRENAMLRDELVSYDALLTSYRELESDRDSILAAFGRANGGKAIAAGVLTHPPLTPYDILIVDAGSAEGVAYGDKVTLPEGGALGVVSEVSAHSSRVEIYTSSGRETPAVLERGGLPVTLSGAGGGSFKLSLPRDASVGVGDRLLLPGLRPELIGVVRDITLEPTDAAKHITVSGIGNISSLRFVSIR